MIPATISTMLSATSPVTAPPKISAGARVIFGVAALLENTPFELYTLIRSGSAPNASATMSRRTIWRSAEICRDHRVCRTRRWREPDSNNRFRVARGRFLSGNANCHRGTGATRGDLEPGQLYAGPRFRIPFPSAVSPRTFGPSRLPDFDEVRKRWRRGGAHCARCGRRATGGTLSSADVEPVVMA